MIYEYNFKSESTIYEESLGLKKGATTKMEAKFIFEMLHHDHGGHVLARYQVMNILIGHLDGGGEIFFLSFLSNFL